MTRVVVACALALAAGACGKSERIKECDALVATAEKIEKCAKLDDKSRAQIKNATKTIKDALQMLDDVGGAGEAPKGQIDQLRQTCQSQHDSIVQLYKKVAPECLE